MDAAIFCAPETGGHKLYPRATGESLLPGNSLLPPSRACVTENRTRLTRHIGTVIVISRRSDQSEHPNI